MKAKSTLPFLCAAAIAALLAIPAARASLVGYWGFNEGTGTTTADATGNATAGTLAPLGVGVTPAWVTGHTGTDKALLFDQGSVTIADNSFLHITNKFTLSYWVKGEQSSNYGHLFTVGSNSSGGSRDWLWQTGNPADNQPYFWSDTQNPPHIGLGGSALATKSATVWHLETLVYDQTLSSQRLKIYEDGVLKASNNTSFSLASWGNLQLGGAGNVYGSGFEGILDDMSIFNAALSATEVGQIFAGTNAEINAVLTPIPEPGSLLALGCLVGSGMFLRSRRRGV